MTRAASSPRWIVVRGAREHNLCDLEVRIPRDRLVVITGLSGSGKSSLAFDTIYAEGQRRYVESLSAYARQFLEQMSKPDVDSIEGLSPAIAIEQKTVGRNPRSTVGTITEISDHLRLLFARVGQPHCPSCDRPIAAQTVQQMVDRVLGFGDGVRVEILSPVVRDRKGSYRKELEAFRRQGFVRARIDGEIRELSEEIQLARSTRHQIELVIDRLVAKESARGRIAESIETALRLSGGLISLDVGSGHEEVLLSERNACIDCGISYPEIAPRMFSFNSPRGACPRCDGLGTRDEFDVALVVPDDTRPLSGAVIAPWSGRSGARYYAQLIKALVHHHGIDPDTPWRKLPQRVRQAILEGSGGEPLEVTVKRRGREQVIQRRWDGVLGELERRFTDGSEAAREGLARARAQQGGNLP